jgi:ABC-type antimicrobial peptide transport system permease subunit
MSSGPRLTAIVSGSFPAEVARTVRRVTILPAYAVASADVTPRTWEASLRLALGASPWRVGAGLVREAAGQMAIGVLAGLALFYLFREMLSSALFRTPVLNPSIVLAASIGMFSLDAAAAAWQARRLARVSPALGLRGHELADR